MGEAFKAIRTTPPEPQPIMYRVKATGQTLEAATRVPGKEPTVTRQMYTATGEDVTTVALIDREAGQVRDYLRDAVERITPEP